ncbi:MULTISPECIES: amidohydrolase family protein [Nocardiopsis]|uniref:amidohydrolase family protein n=1 Tax=Nocardiopsis TaxID=2013 RepID=UPI00036D42A5|nr:MULTISPECIES: amidohydrolase family protein [Nocardiopsis]ASU56201.1 amidohydrolase [Nocardiopsis dassonvillei]
MTRASSFSGSATTDTGTETRSDTAAGTDPGSSRTTDTAHEHGPESAAVRAVWQGLGLPGLIDVHTHFMPDNVLRKVWAHFDALGGLWPINYRFDEDERLSLLRGFGVRHFTALSYPHRPGMAAWLNDWAGDFADRNPDCLRSATFYPEPEARDYVAAALEAGTRVFKAHLQVGRYDPRDPLLADVWGLIADAGTPVVIHCGSSPEEGPFTGPEPFAETLRAHPGLTAVIAHAGAPDYRAFLDLAEHHERVHLDTTMVFTEFSKDWAPFPDQEVPRLKGIADRILFGTDFPNIPYPYLEQIEALAWLGLGDDWLRGVLYGNAARLFGL